MFTKNRCSDLFCLILPQRHILIHDLLWLANRFALILYPGMGA